ncbi:hypothetical protein ACVIJU_003687 [Aeribacillus sp. SP014]|jgi:hypothetical protein
MFYAKKWLPICSYGSSALLDKIENIRNQAEKNGLLFFT